MLSLVLSLVVEELEVDKRLNLPQDLDLANDLSRNCRLVNRTRAERVSLSSTVRSNASSMVVDQY